MAAEQPEVHLRMLTSEDAEWLVGVDRSTTTHLAHPQGWHVEKLAAELDEGVWASDERWGWAVVADGAPAGFALVTDLRSDDGQIRVRLTPAWRGRGVAREVLRQLADHHFAETPSLQRLTGRTHEHNIPMQRAFARAGFRMEARYRDSFRQADGSLASEWGYALTRADWEAGLHRVDEHGYDLHGLTFAVEEVMEGSTLPEGVTLVYRFLQEGRRAIARYHGGHVTEGELAGVLVDDVLTYRFVADLDKSDGHEVVTGTGRARVQRRQDGRLEVVNEWNDDQGRYAKTFLVERT